MARDASHYRVPESLCTGNAPVYDKFLAWARTVPATLRNPLYHWTHLELKRYFGIDELLDEKSAQRIWEQANAVLATPELSAHGILAKFDVKAVCTTDDPTDDLAYHQSIAVSGLATKVFPTFRPDKALNVHNPELFNPWVERLSAVSNTEIQHLPDFVAALRKRHDFFHSVGGRLSDHGLNHAFGDFPHGTRSRPYLRPCPRRSCRHPHGTRAVRGLHDVDLRPPRCREGLDQTAPPGSAAQ